MKEKFIITCMINLLRILKGSYILCPQIDNFEKAVLKCDSINATVVFIDNSAEDDLIRNNYLNDASVSTGIWLAIYDFFGNETNVNYYTNKTLNYTNWKSEHRNNNKYCTVYSKQSNNVNWVHETCSSQNSVLCETEEYATSSTTTTTNSNRKTDTLMNIPTCLDLNPWSFCQLHRQRNNKNMTIMELNIKY
jgi:hypothetical protein